MSLRKIDRFWKDLSVSKKLYTVVGLMAFLIAFELFTLKYTVNILSAARAFVSGEGLWSKAQKNALIEIQNYIIFRDERYYKAFIEDLAVPLGDRKSRLEMMKPDPNYDVIFNGFIEGRNHARDIPGMINLIQRYHSISYLAKAIEAWRLADILIDEVLDLGATIHAEIQKTPRDRPLPNQQELLQKILDVNSKVTLYADNFSYSLGEASRWVEETLYLILLLVILAVESTGIFLTFRFSKTLLRSLNELNTAAEKIGTGDFTQRAPVHSHDELGQLAISLNRMSRNLQEISGEKNQAEEASQVKSLFLANMSHEIRTPLGAILGFVELLKEPNLSEQNRKQYLNIISRTGDTLVTIINDILDLSKVEAGKLEVIHEVFSLSQLLKDLQLLLQLRAEDKGIELIFDASDNTPDTIYSDPLRLRQVLMNIIGNAIKFTNKGNVHVRYELQDDMLVFYVKDTGPGVSNTEVSKLFTPFSQVDLSIRKNHGGTGLGLVLSRKLAQLLGGGVVLESSTVGVGSVFAVKIAYQIPVNLGVKKERIQLLPRPRLADDPVANIEGKNILLVEDTSENQILISHILTKGGAQVKVVSNGQEAVDTAFTEKFDVILMDMQMPILDGYSATSLLRKQGYKMPIISLTAHAMSEDLKKCLDVGCDAVLTKPINKLKLIEVISTYCRKV